MKASGFRVAEARTGLEAVAKARELLPDCILMDLSLPGIDGWEATRQLKADQHDANSRRRHHRPCLRAGLADARAAGCAAYVLKPALPDAVVAEVRKALAVVLSDHQVQFVSLSSPGCEVEPRERHSPNWQVQNPESTPGWKQRVLN